jgi:probable HAF family extracellular repeat protein
MKKGSTILIALILVLGALSNAYAGYTYTPLDYPGASSAQGEGTEADGINNAGTIVGDYEDPSGMDHGFLLSGTTYTPLNYQGASSTDGRDINDAGTIVGYYTDASGKSHGFLLSGTTYTALDYPGAGQTWAEGINNVGTVIGYYKISGVKYGFSLSNGNYAPLNYPGASSTSPAGINNAGTIVGGYKDASGVTHGFTLSGGAYASLDYPGASSTQAFGINNAGTIAGDYTDTSGVTHGFTLSGGAYASLDYPGASSTEAGRINDTGMIVGAYYDASGVEHGFLATPSLTVADSGTGSGTVTSTPSGISCGTTCSASYSSGTSVTLTATPNSGSTFTGWSGACSSKSASATCVITVNGPEAVAAHYIITGVPTFSDVSSTSIYENYIEAIYNNGITTGCGNNQYCPSEQVTRDQMAAFIIRALYGENFPYTLTPYFTDVPSTDIFFKYIQRLKDLAITTTSGTYVPSEGVSRGQMAAFIVRGRFRSKQDSRQKASPIPRRLILPMFRQTTPTSSMSRD